MKKNQMKKRISAALWAVALLAVSAVTAYADLAPEPGPDPGAAQPIDSMMTVLIVAVVIIAAAVVVWRILRSRKNK